MVYYIGKTLQFLGLSIIFIDFLRHFPELMSHRSLLIGAGFFCSGWIIDRFLLKQ